MSILVPEVQKISTVSKLIQKKNPNSLTSYTNIRPTQSTITTNQTKLFFFVCQNKQNKKLKLNWMKAVECIKYSCFSSTCCCHPLKIKVQEWKLFYIEFFDIHMYGRFNFKLRVNRIKNFESFYFFYWVVLLISEQCMYLVRGDGIITWGWNFMFYWILVWPVFIVS